VSDATVPSVSLRAEDDYLYLPFEQAVSPSGGVYFQHFVNCWWTVHPERGLLFYNPPRGRRRRHHGLGRPQCNVNENIIRMVAEKSYAFPVEIRLIPSAWKPVDLDDIL